ncbi:MAG: efflux RND transporter periplasmic adaptor subunit [Gammaproteobacteria bacterium]
MKEFISRYQKWVLPVGVLAVAYAVATVIRNTGPELEVITPEPQPLVVRTVSAQPEQVRLSINSQGEVNAEHMIDLVSELPGKVSRVSPAFVTGGYFKKGDVLLALDATDYELDKVRAQARVAEELEELEIEKSEAELAAKGLFPLREAKVASAEARVQSARAELAQAEADLRRSRVRAPFDGRVLFTQVDLGQYVSTGSALGRIFSTDIAEIRLPLTDQQLRFLNLPFGTGSNEPPLDTPVILSAEVGGQQHSWQGELHRMEGAVDPDNRVWYAVARVNDPYGIKNAAQETPLVVGLFVEAEIEGRTVDDVFRLPRSALRDKDDVLVVDSNKRLRQRKVSVLRTDFESVFISDGLEVGDLICISPVEAFVDGLLVEIVQEPAPDKLAVQ